MDICEVGTNAPPLRVLIVIVSYHVCIPGAILQYLSCPWYIQDNTTRYNFEESNFSSEHARTLVRSRLLETSHLGSARDSCMYVPSFAILLHHSKRRQTTTVSIVTSGATLGSVVSTIMLNKLLNGPTGFKMGVRISATFITSLLLISCILMRTRYSAVRPEVTSFNF